MISLTLPFPPSSNRYWRKTNTGRVYVSEDAKNFKKAVALVSVFARCGFVVGDLSFTARFYRPRRSGDIDNRLKILFDALQGICFKDDKQIAEIHAYRFEDNTNPRVEIEIREI